MLKIQPIKTKQMKYKATIEMTILPDQADTPEEEIAECTLEANRLVTLMNWSGEYPEASLLKVERVQVTFKDLDD